jgi:hypothetical protein
VTHPVDSYDALSRHELLARLRELDADLSEALDAFAVSAEARMKRRSRSYAMAALLAAALALWGLHGMFHLLDLLNNWQTSNPLSFLFAPGYPISQPVHVAVEAFIGLALGVGLVLEVRDRLWRT